MSLDFSDFLPVAPIDENGHYVAIQMADGCWLCIEPQMFRRARLCVSNAAGETCQEALEVGDGYGEVWEFDTLVGAVRAACHRFAGLEVTGWRRHYAGGFGREWVVERPDRDV